jgi:hypothetical protein
MAELKVVATVANEAEAELVRTRLADAGIQALAQRTIGGPQWGSSGSRYVYVDEADLDRATAVLAAQEEPFSEDELARLSEEAAQDSSGER